MTHDNIVDLTMPLANDTPVFPGDPKPSIYPAATWEADGYSVQHMNIATHTGTHVDAPAHFFEDALRIDQLDLNLFVGRGVIIPVLDKGQEDPITVADVESYIPQVGAGDIVLFHTGWARFAGTDQYKRHPYIHFEAARALLDAGARVIGIDALNPDRTISEDFLTHEEILGRGGIIIENLANLEQVNFDEPIISVLPLNIAGGDGSPVRAVAMPKGHLRHD